MYLYTYKPLHQGNNCVYSNYKEEPLLDQKHILLTINGSSKHDICLCFQFDSLNTLSLTNIDKGMWQNI